MFREHEPLARPRAARAAGFDCIEMQFPYDIPLDAIAGAVRDEELSVSVINVPAGDFMDGGAGLAAIPAREAAFAEAIETALRYAEAMRAENVNVLAGVPPRGLDRDACLRTLAANLRRAATAFAETGVRVVVEPINDIDRTGFLLPRVADAAKVLAAVEHPNLAIQFDLYHVAMMGDPIPETFRAFAAQIGHVQFADVPGRHEPGTGTIDFAAAFRLIDGSAYRGWVAAEYFPERRTEDSLGWLS